MVATDHGTRVRQLLKGHNFPATKKEARGRAEQHGAEAELLEAMDNIPEGVYASAGEVAEYVLGKHNRSRRKH